MVNPKIERFSHDDDEFWRVAGRLFASASVRRELGRPMTSSPNHTWWIATLNDDVVGIAAIKTGRARSEFVHAYVLPAYRRMRVYASLLDARIAFARNSGILPIKATATEASTHALMKAGFECVGTRGKYALMELRE